MERFNFGRLVCGRNRLLDYIMSSLNRVRLQSSQCTICHGICSWHPQICNYCLDNLPFFKLEKVEGDLLNWPAMHSLFTKRGFDHLLSVTPYTWPVSHWINQFKYQRRHDYASLLGFLLQYQWQKASAFGHCPDVVLSVPLHVRKWQSRGFNQAHLLAKAFCKYHHIPYRESLLERVKYQQAQVGQSGAKRRQNMMDSFIINAPKQIKGKEVLLIDDVITTGATVNEISRLLKSAGATTVTVLTLCVSIDNC